MTEEEPYGITAKKIGFKFPVSFETFLFEPNGHSEPVGSKWLQRIGWLYYRAVYSVWRVVESHLSRSRHFENVHGYDWEEAYFRKFSQKTKWVHDE